jgi:hypothetical protein
MTIRTTKSATNIPIIKNLIRDACFWDLFITSSQAGEQRSLSGSIALPQTTQCL